MYRLTALIVYLLLPSGHSKHGPPCVTVVCRSYTIRKADHIQECIGSVLLTIVTPVEISSRQRRPSGPAGASIWTVHEPEPRYHHHHHHHHHSLNREGRWGTTGDFATSFLHFSLFSTALWDLPNSTPVHSLMLSSHLFLCPPCLLPPSLCLARWFWTDLMNGKHDHTTAVCVSLRSSGCLRVVQLPAGS